MSCILDAIVGKLVDPIVDIVFKKVVRHVGYVARYKKNMKELEDEKKKLEAKIDENKDKIVLANIRNDVVEKKVEEWAMKADEMKREAEDLVVAMPSNENTKCVKFYCPNICWRYRMSKQAEQMKIALEGHIRDGNFPTVAHLRPLPSERQFQSPTDKFMNFDSRKPLCKKIKDELLAPGVNMVGVYGAGGVGKTTAVEEVCKQLKKEGVFYEVIEGVVSQEANVHAIQLNLARQLDLKFKSDTEEGRADELWTRLNNEKNNLVILDDLWKELNLRAIGIPLKGGNKGCKVILTTRDRKVLKKMEVDDSVEVKVLSEIESWDLFKNKVGINFASDELCSVAELVCKECGGLPVAILAVGGALAGEEHKDSWYDALTQLKNSLWEKVAGIDEKMYASLRLSIDWLAKEDKEALSILFLCCLYPEDAQIPVRFLLFHCIARELLELIDATVETARCRVSTLVTFPSLECLNISRCSSITAICDEQVLPKDSFPQLAFVKVIGCDKLVNVFPSNMLIMGQNLKEIEVEDCKGVEYIVSITGVEQSNQTIIFPYLCKVKLFSLINLKSFCGNSSRSDRQPLFDSQVTFPSLEQLEISYCSSIEKLWELLSIDSFPKLAYVEFRCCEKLVNLFPFNMFTLAQNLKKKKVDSCEGSKNSDNQTISFPSLRKVKLYKMKTLKRFCGCSNASEPQYFFDPLVNYSKLLYFKHVLNLQKHLETRKNPSTIFSKESKDRV